MGAQSRPELRADAILGNTSAVQLGAGIMFPAGNYVRSGLVAGAGWAGGRGSFRGDLVNIFHVDPFRESRWAPYGGGGLSFRYDQAQERSNTFLLVFLGLEGPVTHNLAPALEVGLGGGTRFGVILRRAAQDRR